MSGRAVHEAYQESITRPKGRETHKNRVYDRAGVEGKKVITGVHHQANLIRKQQMLMSTQGQEEETQQQTQESAEDAKRKHNGHFLTQLMHFKATRQGINKALQDSDNLKANMSNFLNDVAKGLNPERMAKLHNLTDNQQLKVASFVLQKQAEVDSPNNTDDYLAKKLNIKKGDIQHFGDDNIYVKWAKENGIQEDGEEKLVFQT